MATVMTMKWAGVTPEQYHAVREVVGWERDRPDGGRLHVAWCDDQGLRVWDVWDGAEDFQAFVEGRLMPGVATVGIAGAPDVEFLDLHYYQKEDVDPAGAVVGLGDFPDAATYDRVAAEVNWSEVPPIDGVAHIAGARPDGTVTTTARAFS